MISSIIRLESRTTQKNYDNNSMSFYDFRTIDSMSWLMSHKEILLVHTNSDTEESKTTVISGTKLFNSLQCRKIKNGCTYLIYRY